MIIALVILMLLFFAVGALSLLSLRSDFAKEAAYLEAFKRELHSQSQSPSAFYQSIKTSSVIPNESIVFERVEILFKLSDHGVTPNLSEISDLAISRKETRRGNQFVNFVLSTLLISGLGGTFLAFREILVSSDISQAVSNGVVDMRKYTEVVTRIYDGFNSAFWASICGVFGTVILLFLKFIVVNPVKDRFYNSLDTVTQSELVPMFSELRKRPDDLLSKTAVKLDALLNALQPISQDFNNASIKATGALIKMNQFAAMFSGATSKFSDFTAPNSPFLSAIGKLFDGVEKYESRYHHYETALNKLIQEVTNQNVRLAETQNMFVQFHTTLESVHKQFRIELEQSNNNYRAGIDRMNQAFSNEVRTIIQSTAQVVEGSPRVSADLHDRQNTYAKEFRAATDRLDSAMDKIDATARSLESSVTRMDTSAQKLTDSSTQINEKLRGIERSINAIGLSPTEIEAIQQSLRTINRTLERKKFTFSLFGWKP